MTDPERLIDDDNSKHLIHKCKSAKSGTKRDF